MDVKGNEYLIKLRKSKIDLEKYEVCEKDIIDYRKLMNSKSDMEIIKILIDYDRLVKIEEYYKKLLIDYAELDISMSEILFSNDVLESKVKKRDEVIKNLRESQLKVYDIDREKERLNIKDKIEEALGLIEYYHNRDLKLAELSLSMVKGESSDNDFKKEVPVVEDFMTGNSELDKKLRDFLVGKGVTNESQLSEVDKFNFRFLKNQL